MESLPVIDVTALVEGGSGRDQVAAQMGRACEAAGFFYVVGHGVDEGLQRRLEELSRQFFAQDLTTKRRIRMELGGRAWRGYFGVGDELTSGVADVKEGIYFGSELEDDHPLVRAGTPLHGRNLFPDLPGFRETVLAYIDAVTRLGHALMRGLATSLGLDESYFAARYTAEPFLLFRIFNYPPTTSASAWGVGEHTDYGVLTILRQDDSGGLEIRARGAGEGPQWIAAPPVPGSFVCNIGDMLDRMTAGRYRSTLHRVRNSSARDRLSFPFFFDPSFAAEVEPIPLAGSPEAGGERWDGANLHELRGTYGSYLLGKVAKVFPDLKRRVL